MAIEPVFVELLGAGVSDGVGTLTAATVDHPEQIRLLQHSLWTGHGAAPFTISAPVTISGAQRTVRYPVVLPPGTSKAVVQVWCAGAGTIDMSFDGFGIVRRRVGAAIVQRPDLDVTDATPIGVTRASALQSRAAADYVWAGADLLLDCTPDGEIQILAVYIAPVFADADGSVVVVA